MSSLSADAPAVSAAGSDSIVEASVSCAAGSVGAGSTGAGSTGAAAAQNSEWVLMEINMYAAFYCNDF